MIIKNNLILCNNIYKLINLINEKFNIIIHISYNKDLHGNIIDFNMSDYTKSITWKILNELNIIFKKYQDMGIIEYTEDNIININIFHNNEIFNIYSLFYL